jgi:hypothetical protein
MKIFSGVSKPYPITTDAGILTERCSNSISGLQMKKRTGNHYIVFLKTIILWDVTPCLLVEDTDVLEERTASICKVKE